MNLNFSEFVPGERFDPSSSRSIVGYFIYWAIAIPCKKNYNRKQQKITIESNRKWLVLTSTNAQDVQGVTSFKHVNIHIFDYHFLLAIVQSMISWFRRTGKKKFRLHSQEWKSCSLKRGEGRKITLTGQSFQ